MPTSIVFFYFITYNPHPEFISGSFEVPLNLLDQKSQVISTYT